MKQAYLLVGDPFLVERKRGDLISRLQKEAGNNLSQIRCNLRETSLDALLTDARTLPFLVESQVFLLENIDRLKEPHLKSLHAYLENPNLKSTLIFETPQLGKKDALVSLVGQYGEVFFLEEKEKKTSGVRFIHEKLKQFKKRMGPKAMARLDQQVGDMPMFLNSILDQLILLAGETEEITDAMVESIEENWQQTDVFQFVQAIARQDTEQSLYFMKCLLEEENMDWVSLVGVLHWQMRRFWLAQTLLKKGLSESEAFRQCRVYPRQAPYFRRQLGQLPSSKIEAAIEQLFNLDWKVKTGMVDGPQAMETWVVQMTS